jgi:hypothetical protein
MIKISSSQNSTNNTESKETKDPEDLLESKIITSSAVKIEPIRKPEFLYLPACLLKDR